MLGSFEFGLTVNYGGSRDRLAYGAQVEAGVKQALAKAGFPQGTGETIAQPIKSVNFAGRAVTEAVIARSPPQVDTCPTSASACTFTITLVTFGPHMQRISQAVQELAFRKNVAIAVRAAGGTSVLKPIGTRYVPIDFVGNNVLGFAVQDKTLPSDGSDGSGRLEVVFTMMVSGSVSDFDEARKTSLRGSIAVTVGVDASAITSMTVEAASVIITTTIEVDEAAAAALQSSITTNLGTAAAASAALGITVESDPYIEEIRPTTKKSSPAPEIQNSFPELDDSGAANQTLQEDSIPEWAIVLIVLIILCVFGPLLCCCHARLKYGKGKVGVWLQYRLSHSNLTFPLLYKAHEERERIRKQLYGETAVGDEATDDWASADLTAKKISSQTAV